MLLFNSFHILIPSDFHTLSVDEIQLQQQLFFVLKNVSEFLPVPFTDLHFQGFKLLLKSKHYSSLGGTNSCHHWLTRFLNSLCSIQKLSNLKGFPLGEPVQSQERLMGQWSEPFTRKTSARISPVLRMMFFDTKKRSRQDATRYSPPRWLFHVNQPLPISTSTSDPWARNSLNAS